MELAVPPTREVQQTSDEFAYREARALIAWMPEDAAVRALLGGRNPGPGDDVGALEDRVRAYRAALSAMAPRQILAPMISDGWSDLQARASGTDIQAAFASMNWRLALVDLRRVLSFQKLVFTEGLEQRVREGVTPEQLTELCLPTRNAELPRGAFTDADGKAITLSSLNPNLRVAGMQLGQASVAPGPGQPTQAMTSVTVLVSMGASYVQVAGYRGRYFVRDGNHRVAGMIRRGIFEVPCVLIEARSFEELVGTADAFTYEVLFGEKPPFVTDFWDNSIAGEVTQAAIRKVVRVVADEFVVPR